MEKEIDNEIETKLRKEFQQIEREMEFRKKEEEISGELARLAQSKHRPKINGDFLSQVWTEMETNLDRLMTRKQLCRYNLYVTEDTRFDPVWWFGFPDLACTYRYLPLVLSNFKQHYLVIAKWTFKNEPLDRLMNRLIKDIRLDWDFVAHYEDGDYMSHSRKPGRYSNAVLKQMLAKEKQPN